jgi:hypothetical protein
MIANAKNFWKWFAGFAKRLPSVDPPESMLDELLAEIHHRLDDRIYFEMSTNTPQKELILTACGNVAVFPIIDAIIGVAPSITGWSFVALKPAQGFAFSYRDGEIELDIAELWFMPLQSTEKPTQLGLRLAVPDADTVLARQSVDIAHTILETAIGERLCATAIQHVEIGILPTDPAADGYLKLSQLGEYLQWRAAKSEQGTGSNGTN